MFELIDGSEGRVFSFGYNKAGHVSSQRVGCYIVREHECLTSPYQDLNASCSVLKHVRDF